MSFVGADKMDRTLDQKPRKLMVLTSKEEDALKSRFNMLELYHILYVLLAAHFLAVLYSPAIQEKEVHIQ